MSESMDELDIIEEGTEVVANRASKMERLENEGDLAADYLEELLDIVDLDGDIEIDVENGRALVEIVTGDAEPDRRLKRLIGRHGEVLETDPLGSTVSNRGTFPVDARYCRLPFQSPPRVARTRGALGCAGPGNRRAGPAQSHESV